MSVCPGISYRHQLQFQETSLSVPYLRDIFNIHSRWFLFLDVHSFLISINLRMISPCLGFSFLYRIRFFFFECCCFVPTTNVSKLFWLESFPTQVPSDEKCTWDRQKLKLQIERGTMLEAPSSCCCVLLCYGDEYRHNQSPTVSQKLRISPNPLEMIHFL